MNIHDSQRYGPRKRGYKPHNTAKPPRTREGLKGRGQGKTQRMASVLFTQSQFPGGKALRRAMARLELRNKDYQPVAKPSGHANSKPGSMKG